MSNTNNRLDEDAVRQKILVICEDTQIKLPSSERLAVLQEIIKQIIEAEEGSIMGNELETEGQQIAIRASIIGLLERKTPPPDGTKSMTPNLDASYTASKNMREYILAARLKSNGELSFEAEASC